MFNFLILILIIILIAYVPLAMLHRSGSPLCFVPESLDEINGMEDVVVQSTDATDPTPFVQTILLNGDDKNEKQWKVMIWPSFGRLRGLLVTSRT